MSEQIEAIGFRMVQAEMPVTFVLRAVALARKSEGITDMIVLWAEAPLAERDDIVAELYSMLEDHDPSNANFRINSISEAEDELTRRMTNKAHIRDLIEQHGGIGKISKASGIPRSSLVRMLKTPCELRYTTISRLSHAMGLPMETILSSAKAAAKVTYEDTYQITSLKGGCLLEMETAEPCVPAFLRTTHARALGASARIPRQPRLDEVSSRTDAKLDRSRHRTRDLQLLRRIALLKEDTSRAKILSPKGWDYVCKRNREIDRFRREQGTKRLVIRWQHRQARLRTKELHTRSRARAAEHLCQIASDLLACAVGDDLRPNEVVLLEFAVEVLTHLDETVTEIGSRMGLKQAAAVKRWQRARDFLAASGAKKWAIAAWSRANKGSGIPKILPVLPDGLYARRGLLEQDSKENE